MAHELKTSIGDRNVLVQNGAGKSTTVWLEIQHADGLDCLALTPLEATAIGRALIAHSIKACSRVAQADHDLLSQAR